MSPPPYYRQDDHAPSPNTWNQLRERFPELSRDGGFERFVLTVFAMGARAGFERSARTLQTALDGTRKRADGAAAEVLRSLEGDQEPTT